MNGNLPLVPVAIMAVVLIGGVGCSGRAGAGEEVTREIRFTIVDRPIGHLDSRLFGQFMERPSWARETGVEAALVPGTRRLQESVRKLLVDVKIRVLRFPGGTDVDFTDWRDMVDNVPGREGGRPPTIGHTGDRVTNGFGYDEFLQLCEELGAEALLVVNFRDGLLREKPLEKAAQHAAGLVAYCTAPVGAPRPEQMEDWAALRARNGRAQPHRVRYVQIGNETWQFWDDLAKMGLSEEEATDWYLQCLETYVEAIRAVAPSVETIADAHPLRLLPLYRERLGNRVQYVAHHLYLPWDWSRGVTRNGEPYPLAEMTAEEIWNAQVGVPDIDGAGNSIDDSDVYEAARRAGYQVAITEWNWNGYRGRGTAALDSSFARGIGAAGFLQAFMREGEAVGLGCQSMLVGTSWGITSIRVDAQRKQPAYFLPTGQVTMFYDHHHGPDLLEVQEANVPRYGQPFGMGDIRPKDGGVATVDTLATADQGKVYLHAINRSFTEDLKVTVALSGFAGVGEEAVQWRFEGRLEDRPRGGRSPEVARIEGTPVAINPAGNPLI